MAQSSVEPLSIGEVARLADVGVETVRFYERESLIAEPPRRESGYRQYPRGVIARIRFIKRARELGFSLKEIKTLLSLRVDPSTTCSDVRERAEAKIAKIDRTIRDLQKIRAALEGLRQACALNDPRATECPLLDTLEGFGDDEN